LRGVGLVNTTGALGEAEIQNFDAARIGRLRPGDQHVIRLQIAMRETGCVRRR
jgi:hypothetical protein